MHQPRIPPSRERGSVAVEGFVRTRRTRSKPAQSTDKKTPIMEPSSSKNIPLQRPAPTVSRASSRRPDARREALRTALAAPSLSPSLDAVHMASVARGWCERLPSGSRLAWRPLSLRPRRHAADGLWRLVLPGLRQVGR
eukprot:scaffold74050_cov37-Tisochrysis_lutea.AAC.10